MGRTIFNLSGLLLAGSVLVAQAQTTSPVDISGTVNDANSGAAVAGAKVWIAGNPDVTTTTGADGSFHLTGQATVGIKAGRAAKTGMSFQGSQLTFSAMGNTPVTVELFNLKNQRVATLVNQTLSAGRYAVNAAPANLSAGVYVVRAKVGAQSASFKVSPLSFRDASGPALRAAGLETPVLAKVSADVIDSLKVSKSGYHTLSKGITKFTGIFPLNMDPGLVPGDLKIVSERNIPQVAWGKNVDVQVWDGGTQLKGDYKPNPYEGTQSWLVTFTEGQPYNAWGFVANTAPEDMSAWKDGAMHIAVKGNAHSVGLTMASYDQGDGTSLKVDLRNYGYVADTSWHDLKIPMSDFTGVDFSQVKVYCGLVYPVEADTALFDASSFYQVDDIWWSTTK